MLFENKTAIITGAGSGIGLEVAKRMHQAGANIVMNGRNAVKLEDAADSISQDRSRIHLIAADIALPATAEALAESAETAFGGLDILINNAGIFEPKPFLELSEAEYDRFLDII